MRVYIICFFIYVGAPLFCQECKEEFKDNFIVAYNKMIIKNTQIEKIDVGNKDNSSIRKIPIGLVFASKEGASAYNNRNEDVLKLLCNLNTTKVLLDEILIFNDSLVLGYIGNYGYKKKSYKYYDINVEYFKFRYSLLDYIRRIEPEYLFRIYNLSNCYFFIKNEKIFVLSFKHEGQKTYNYMINEVSIFIEEYIKKEDLIFLHYKKTEDMGN